MDGRYQGITYGRYGTPTTRSLEEAIATLGVYGELQPAPALRPLQRRFQPF